MFLEANIFQPLIDVFNTVITWLHDDVGLGWGLAIVALTFMSRAVVLPLTLRSMHGMREMQALQPYIKELQEKYKDDKQRMQREQMALFQEHGVNPIASCLPLILQIPVFIALYGLLRSAEFKAEVIASGDPGFWGVPDLTAHPHGSTTIVLVILAAVTLLASTLVTPTPTTGGASQRYIMAFAFAGIIVIFIPNAPAGIAVYWIATSIWQLGQQFVIRLVWPLPPTPTPQEARAAKPPPPPPRKRKRRR